MPTRSDNTPPVGSKVHFIECGTIATVTGHTDRGFTYKDGPRLSIPRLGVQGTGEGECFTDVSGWMMYVMPVRDVCRATGGIHVYNSDLLGLVVCANEHNRVMGELQRENYRVHRLLERAARELSEIQQRRAEEGQTPSGPIFNILMEFQKLKA